MPSDKTGPVNSRVTLAAGPGHTAAGRCRGWVEGHVWVDRGGRDL